MEKGKVLLIRAEATAAIGTGHVMRCLALAQAWHDAGGKSIFAMTDSVVSMEERIRSEDMEVVRLARSERSSEDAARLLEVARVRGAEWVVADGYQFDGGYQRSLKDGGLKLLFVDDYSHAEYYVADLVLNQNAHAREVMYHRREPYTRLLLGPHYAMLRREFAAWRDWTRIINPTGRKVLVTMGGSDPDNVTLQVVHALQLVEVERLEATVVAGDGNPHFESLERAVLRLPGVVRLERNVRNMGELMTWADVVISAAGSTCWEICLLGLPAILIDLAENQYPIAHELDRRGCGIHLGSTSTVSAETIAGKLEWLLLSPEVRKVLSGHAQELVDGEGATRVLSAMVDGR
jgi:UDP-2,4-diacetamido-2,4,6-trideoxy-beta-L-altropyranose hydrolase